MISCQKWRSNHNRASPLATNSQTSVVQRESLWEFRAATKRPRSPNEEAHEKTTTKTNDDARLLFWGEIRWILDARRVVFVSFHGRHFEQPAARSDCVAGAVVNDLARRTRWLVNVFANTCCTWWLAARVSDIRLPSAALWPGVVVNGTDTVNCDADGLFFSFSPILVLSCCCCCCSPLGPGFTRKCRRHSLERFWNPRKENNRGRNASSVT